MESVRFTCHTDRTEILFGEVLDASRVRAAYQHLDEALARGFPLELDASKVERIDAAGLQLLMLFLHVARGRGLKSKWRSVSSNLRAGAAVLGMVGSLELPA